MENEKKDEVVFCPKCGAMITGEYCFFCGSSREGDKTSGESPYETLGKGAWADNSSQQIWLIKDYMANNILALLIFNFLFGLIGVLNSSACQSAKKSNNYALAQEKSNAARSMFNIALAIFLIKLVIAVVAIVMQAKNGGAA